MASSTSSTPASVTANESGGGGLSISDKIALGLGIGFGIPTLVIGIVQIRRMSQGQPFLGRLSG